MPSPSLALVIPCLDDATLLARCLDSFARQTRPPEMVIVVDNGSRDESVDVARSRGVIVISEPHRGVTWAARAGYDEAARRGADIIVRTDADAWADASFCQSLLDVWGSAHARKRVVGITGPAEFDLPRLSRAASALYLGAYRASVGSALGHAPFFGTNCSFTAAWWLSVRDSIDPSDTASHDDIALSFAVRPDETVLYRPHPALHMDARALRGLTQLRRRFARGVHSMRRGFSTSPPHVRLARRGQLGARAQRTLS
ncbi:glycosyltransferase [Corynebacterium capitovis]|uniref:glycosyltransferase n=1 Tax=Corynebacterium capitovis TaxID=131081 RepID=UPI00058ADEDD|nr:glycosyltransferase family 2 protein [Corynebacterium capitovis]